METPLSVLSPSPAAVRVVGELIPLPGTPEEAAALFNGEALAALARVIWTGCLDLTAQGVPEGEDG